MRKTAGSESGRYVMPTIVATPAGRAGHTPRIVEVPFRRLRVPYRHESTHTTIVVTILYSRSEKNQ